LPTVLLTGILALLGIGWVVGLPAGPAAGSKQAPAVEPARDKRPAAVPAAPHGERFWQPLADFQRVVAGRDKLGSGALNWPGFPDVADYEVEFLIALVPDPFDSNAGYHFDDMVDSIQRAAEEYDYVLDRYWYPWEEARAPAQPGGAPADVQV